jgi:redox-sensitive bicupin YhaK (pirin superfamily)
VTRLFSPGDLGRQIKPFVFLDRIDMEASAGALFGWHPHSGIATITTVVKGDTAYADSTGAEGILKAGGVEFMQAGGGVWHTANPAEPGRVLGYQLWLALPEAIENALPYSAYVAPEDVPTIGSIRVILGQYGDLVSPIPQLSSLTYLHVKMKAREVWTYKPQAGQDVAWVAVTNGRLEVAGVALSSELAVFDEGDSAIIFRAQDDVDFMLGSAAKHPHPLVTGDYSVHTNREALRIGEAGIKTVGNQIRADGKI